MIKVKGGLELLRNAQSNWETFKALTQVIIKDQMGMPINLHVVCIVV